MYINLPNLFLYLYLYGNLSILYKSTVSQNQLSLYNLYVIPLLKNIFQKWKNLSYIERLIDILSKSLPGAMPVECKNMQSVFYLNKVQKIANSHIKQIWQAAGKQI